MCTSPRTIKNPRKHFIAGVDKEYIKVPCGKCFECRNKKRNEVYVLAYYEHLQALALGGHTQFFTLTFDNINLPTHGFRPCFSREKVKKFLLDVNYELKKLFGKDFRMRYLLVCEYGSSDTHRPHHHGLIFLQQKTNSYLFLKLLQRCWPYGFSLGSFDNFGVINRPQGIRYVTKYVSKDMFDSEKDDDYLQECKEYSTAAWYSAKKVLPFSFRSKRFGRFSIAHILDGDSLLPVKWRTSLDTLLSNKLIIPSIDGVPRLIELPRSLQRQLFYKCNYRYKKVTPKYREDCEIRGTDIPKHRVETHYIPNPLFRDWKKNMILSGIKKDSENVKVIDVDSSECLSVYRWLRPDYNFWLKKSDLDLNAYVDKCIDIMMEREPIYYRCPFDKDKFLVDRFEMDIDSVPECVEFLNSQYNSDYEEISRKVDDFIFGFNNNRKVSNDIIEKSYRDNKTLKYHA